MKAFLNFVCLAWWVYFLVGGYIYNVLNLLNYETLELSAALVLQFTGVFIIPLGILLGWII